jgi:signal transduction histidine kinase
VYARHRWLTPAGLAIVALVIFANAFSNVGLGTSGKPLVVSVGVALYAVAAVLFLLWFEAAAWANIALLLVMAGASVATHHGDPTGTGGIGLYLGMVFAPLRLPLRTAAVVCVASALAFDVQLALEADNPGVFAVVVDGGAAFFFLMGVLLRAEHEQRTRADRLVRELEASREAERAAAAVAERSRLAREMHDVLAHTLSGLVLHLDGAKLLAGAGRVDELPDTLDRAQTLARDGLTEARAAISALRGDTVLGPEGLADLVAEHQQSGGDCALTIDGDPAALAPDARLAIYRTAQEALNNVRKHAPHAHVDMRLDCGEDGATLTVQDSGGTAHDVLDGSGAGYGLSGIAERAALLGGQFTAGPCGAGFRVELHVPGPAG